jgi:hypothetical protein
MGIALLLASVTACGGGTPPPDAPAPPAASPLAPSTTAVTPPPPVAPPIAPAAAPPPPAPSPAAEAWSDPNEKPDGFVLAPLFDKKKSKASFPKKTANDADCWATVGVTGDHTKDYAAIVAACGAPTGLAEYVHPIEGKLHHLHDPRDVYKISLLGGYCYRYFAVADSGIADLDLLIEKPGGALVGDDKTNSPIAIIESDKPWCVDEDQTLEFHVQVDGPGSGGYLFGAWARPKH